MHRPKTFREKFELWKMDLDRTQGYQIEAILGRTIDQFELWQITQVINKNKQLLETGKGNTVLIQSQLKYQEKQQQRLTEIVNENKINLKNYKSEPLSINKIVKELCLRKKPYENCSGLRSILKKNKRAKSETERKSVQFHDDLIDIVEYDVDDFPGCLCNKE